MNPVGLQVHAWAPVDRVELLKLELHLVNSEKLVELHSSSFRVELDNLHDLEFEQKFKLLLSLSLNLNLNISKFGLARPDSVASGDSTFF